MNHAYKTLFRSLGPLPVTLLFGFILVVGRVPTLAQEIDRSPASIGAKSVLPADVIAFKARRDRCDHLRGEDSGDDQGRSAQLQRDLQQACVETDASLAALRHHYSNDKAVQAALAGYENQIE